MNIQEVTRIYNEYERKGSTLGGYTKVVTPEVVKFVSDTQYGSFISFFDLNDENVDSVIEREKAYFAQRDLAFEWKVYDTDLPISIDKKLISHGFEKGESESFMALSLDELSMIDVDNDACVEVSDEQGIKDAISVQEQVWGGSTLKAYRGKGYYSTLLHQRMNDAIKRDIQYLIIDASDMSKPIVEKYGFQFIAKTTPYTIEA